MKMLTVMLTLAVLFFAATAAFSGTATNTVTATATVIANCVFSSTTNISFGNYDPTVATNTTGNGSVTWKCTKGDTVDNWLSAGPYTMTNGGNSLTYTVYTNASLTTAWPTSSPGVQVTSGGVSSPTTETLYGQIAAGQDVPAGTYTGTLTFNISF